MYIDPDAVPLSSSLGDPTIILLFPIATESPNVSPAAPSEAVILSSLVPSKS